MLDLIKRVGLVIILGSFLVTLGVSSVHAAPGNTNLYSLKVKTVGNGDVTITPDLKTYPLDMQVNLNAIPDTTSWTVTVNGHQQQSPGGSNLSFQIKGDTVVEAVFPQ